MTDMEREVYEMDELCRKEFEESYYNSSSIFSQGRYELLWASFGEEHFLQSAQNAGNQERGFVETLCQMGRR